MKAPTEQDLFGDAKADWVDSARQIQFKLGSIRNSYVGNKRKILPDLAEILYKHELHTKIPGGKVLDLFAGSSFVGYLFKGLGAAVWSNEILASSFLNAVCFIENDDIKIDCAALNRLLRVRKDAAGPASRQIGVRFTEREAQVLDSFLLNMGDEGFPVDYCAKMAAIVEDSKACTSKLRTFGMSPQERAITEGGMCVKSLVEFSGRRLIYRRCFYALMVIHYVMNHCYVGGRLNGGQILAKLDHRLEHDRNQGHEMSFKRILPYNLPFSNGKACVATKMDAIELLKAHEPDVDIVYIDPPYGGEQSDYGNMYSFFEEYLGFPQELGSDRFTKNKTYDQSFNELLSHLPKNAVWIFSYNDDSWANLDTIVSCIKQFGNRQVLPEKIAYEYNYRSKEKASGKEYIIVALP